MNRKEHKVGWATARRLAVLGLLTLVLCLCWTVLCATTSRNPHLEALISTDPDIRFNDDAVGRGELAAAGDAALPFLMATLRAEPGWAERTLRRVHQRWYRQMAEALPDKLYEWFWDRAYRSEGVRRAAADALVLLGKGAAPARDDIARWAASNGPLWVQALATMTAISPNDLATRSNFLDQLSLPAPGASNQAPFRWNSDLFGCADSAHPADEPAGAEGNRPARKQCRSGAATDALSRYATLQQEAREALERIQGEGP